MALTGDPWAFEPIDDDNNMALPVGAPENSMQFRDYNNSQRYTKAAVRVLADASALLQSGMPAKTEIGTLALQDSDDVSITGGTISDVAISGASIIGSCQQILTTLAGITFSNGNPVIGSVTYTQWYLCDGSQYSIPSGPLSGVVQVPNLRGLALIMGGANGVVQGTSAGSLGPFPTPISEGEHTHSVADSQPASATDQVIGGAGVNVASSGHGHEITDSGTHVHNVTVQMPPNFGVDTIVRLW